MEFNYTIRHANEHDIPMIQEMAHKIWPAAYNHILPGGQVDYMLRQMYSPESLTEQMLILHHQFLILEYNGTELGFASYSKIEPEVYKLNKLYVLPELQGKGAGRKLLDKVIKNIKLEHAKSLILTVNRNNSAKEFYVKQGFVVTHEEKTNIGNGFFMDDYIMKLVLD